MIAQKVSSQLWDQYATCYSSAELHDFTSSLLLLRKHLEWIYSYSSVFVLCVGGEQHSSLANSNPGTKDIINIF